VTIKEVGSCHRRCMKDGMMDEIDELFIYLNVEAFKMNSGPPHCSRPANINIKKLLRATEIEVNCILISARSRA